MTMGIGVTSLRLGDGWKFAGKVLGKAVLYFLWSTFLLVVVTLPAFGLLHFVGVPREFYVTAFVSYAVFNFSVTLKNLPEIKRVIEESEIPVKMLFGMAFLILNVLLVVYPVFGWIMSLWINPQLALWIPFFLIWWEVSAISGKRKVLAYFTVTWLLVLIFGILRGVFNVTQKVEMKAAMSPVAAFVILLVALMRKN